MAPGIKEESPDCTAIRSGDSAASFANSTGKHTAKARLDTIYLNVPLHPIAAISTYSQFLDQIKKTFAK